MQRKIKSRIVFYFGTSIFLLGILSACGKNAGAEIGSGAIPNQAASVGVEGTPSAMLAENLTPTEVPATPTEVPLIPTEVPATPTEVPPTPTEIPPMPTESPMLTESPSQADLPASTPVPTEALPFDPQASYMTLELQEGMTFYFCEDEENPQVILEFSRGDTTIYDTYDLEYSLKYGKPLVGIGPSDDPLLVLPTAEMAEPLSPIGAYEVCGKIYRFQVHWIGGFDDIIEEHLRPQVNQLDNIRADLFLKESIAEYRNNEDGERVFTLELSTSIRPTIRQIFSFPNLNLPEQEVYPIVFEETSHFTETFLEYRRVGVSVGDSIVWLGKFCINAAWEQDWSERDGRSEWDCDYLFFPDKELGYFAGGHSNAQKEGELSEGRVCRLEMDDWADLDNDGKEEQISYRKVLVDGRDLDLVIYADGEEIFRKEIYNYYSYAEYPYIASLDGATLQLLLLDYEVGRSEIFHIYRYEKDGLQQAGEFKTASYSIEKEEGRNIYCVLDDTVAPLQNDVILRKYEFSEGSLHEIEQEYYKFLASGWGDENNPPEARNVFTVKQDILLYYEKGGGETFLLPAGSRAATLGGDLKEWILIKNWDTEEKGWIKVDWHENSYTYSVFTCILPDGSQVWCDDLFEGLANYN